MAVAAAGDFVTQLLEGDPVDGLVCEDAPVEVLVQGAGLPTTELMAMGERPAACFPDLPR